MINLFVFIFYFFFILISVLGFGYFLKYYFKIDLENNCYGLIGLFGILFILIYSYATNLFFAHSKIHNFIFLFIGFIFFFYYNFFISKIDKKELYLSLAIFFTLLIGIFIFKAHDDFIYYHFPYAYYLTEQKLMIGIGQLLQGYRTPSSLFYFNSLLNLPFVDYYLFNFFPIYVLGFANIILLKKILVKKSEFKSNQSYIYYLSLIIFIFINIFFYRIAEHGTDRSAQILIFVLVVEILDQISKKNINFKFIYKIYFLLSIIISLKAFYFLYLVFLIPLLAKEFNYTKKMNILIGKFLLNKYFYLFITLIFFVVLSYFLNTGCLLYPVHFTCFENLDWAISKENVKSSNDWFELWSKAGATPNYILENREIYIQKFNWVNIWFKEYFFTKVSDFLLGITVLSSIVYISFFKAGKTYSFKIINYNFLGLYILLIILFFEWFYNHPALRYGGYCIISLLIFIPLAKFIENIKIDYKKYFKLSLILILISLTVFVLRNINRINYEIDFYSYNLVTNPSYELSSKHFRMQEYKEKLISNYENCKAGNKKCDESLELKMSKYYGYYIINKR